MKLLKRIIGWSLLALAIQSVIYFGIETYYGKSLLNTKSTEVRVDKSDQKKKNVSVNIPGSASKVETSYDGKFISYYDQNKLNVINSFDGTKKVVESEKNLEQIYNKWLPDVNSMVICERSSNAKNNTEISIFTYNADNDNKQSPTDTNNKEIKFKVKNSTDKIEDIQMSTTMGIFYVKIKDSRGLCDIINNNVNGMNETIFSSRNIGNISVFKHKPNLIYEDTPNSTTKITNSKWSINYKSTCLFDVDDEDKLYIGVLQNGKVSKILYGPTEKKIEQWTTINLAQPVDKKDVIVTRYGTVYINDSTKGCIISKPSEKNISYKGKLLRITDEEVISNENGKLQKASLK